MLIMNSEQQTKILDRYLRPRNGATYIIAEIGINHNGSLERAFDLIGEAARAGADAAKFQNWVAEDFISDREQIYSYKSNGREISESFYDLCKRNELGHEWLPKLAECCKAEGIDFLSTPTTTTGVDDLLKLGLRVLKNGSDYLSNIPLITYMAEHAPVVIISTGMAWQKDVDYAVSAAQKANPDTLPVLLHCTSIYPTPIKQANLSRMCGLARRYALPVGFSDHTCGWEAAVQAVTLGARVLEKHFTLYHDDEGPDHSFSLTPQELRQYVNEVRDAEDRMGSIEIAPATDELEIATRQRLSAVAAINLSAGAILTAASIAFKKPGTGINPPEIIAYYGRMLSRDVSINEVFTSDMFL